MEKYRRKKYQISFILAFLFGGIGAHLFYLKKIKRGSLYLLFCWTGIPIILGWLDMISVRSWVDVYNKINFPKSNISKKEIPEVVPTSVHSNNFLNRAITSTDKEVIFDVKNEKNTIREKEQEREEQLRKKKQLLGQLPELFSSIYDKKIEQEREEQLRKKKQLLGQLPKLFSSIYDKKIEQEREEQLRKKKQLLGQLPELFSSIYDKKIEHEREEQHKERISFYLRLSSVLKGVILDKTKQKDILESISKSKEIPLLIDANLTTKAKRIIEKVKKGEEEKVLFGDNNTSYNDVNKFKFYDETVILIKKYRNLECTQPLKDNISMMKSFFFQGEFQDLEVSKRAYEFTKASLEYQNKHSSSTRGNEYILDMRNLTFEDLTGEQKNWYFQWREEALKLNFLETNLSYIHLFLYELANYSFNENPNFNISMMVRLFENYKSKYAILNQVVPQLISCLLMELEEHNLSFIWLDKSRDNRFSHDLFIELSTKADWSNVSISKWNHINKVTDKTPFFDYHKQEIYRTFKIGVKLLKKYYQEQNKTLLREWFNRSFNKKLSDLYVLLKSILFRKPPINILLIDEYIITESMKKQIAALYEYAEILVKDRVQEERKQHIGVVKKRREFLKERMEGVLSKEFLETWDIDFFGPTTKHPSKDKEMDEQNKRSIGLQVEIFYNEKSLILPNYIHIKTPPYIKKHIKRMNNSYKTDNWDTFLNNDNYYGSESGLNFTKYSLRYSNMKGGYKSKHISFFQYWSSFEHMNPEQKKWYFFWREEVLNHRYPDTDLSYIFVFIYELINYSFNHHTSFNVSMMIRLFNEYKDRHSKLGWYLPEWIGHMFLEANETEFALRWLQNPSSNKVYERFKNLLAEEKELSTISVKKWNYIPLNKEKSDFFYENRNKIYRFFKFGMGLLQEHYKKENISILDIWFERGESKADILLFNRTGNVLPRGISSFSVSFEQLIPTEIMKNQLTVMYLHAENMVKKIYNNDELVDLPKEIVPIALLEAWEAHMLDRYSKERRTKKKKSPIKIRSFKIPERPTNASSADAEEIKQPTHLPKVTFNDDNIQQIEKENEAFQNSFLKYQEPISEQNNQPVIAPQLLESSIKAVVSDVIEFKEETINLLLKENDTLLKHFEKYDEQPIEKKSKVEEKNNHMKQTIMNEKPLATDLSKYTSPNLLLSFDGELPELLKALNEVEKHLLSCFIDFTLLLVHANEKMKKRGKMLNVVIQDINDKAFRILGDNLIEVGNDECYIYEEYNEILILLNKNKPSIDVSFEHQTVSSHLNIKSNKVIEPINNSVYEEGVNEFMDSLEEHEIFLLTCFQSSSISLENAKQSMKAKGKMINIVLQNINEKAIEFLGDNLIEQLEKEYVIYEEYKDILNLIKRE